MGTTYYIHYTDSPQDEKFKHVLGLITFEQGAPVFNQIMPPERYIEILMNWERPIVFFDEYGKEYSVGEWLYKMSKMRYWKYDRHEARSLE